MALKLKCVEVNGVLLSVETFVIHIKSHRIFIKPVRRKYNLRKKKIINRNYAEKHVYVIRNINAYKKINNRMENFFLKIILQ